MLEIIRTRSLDSILTIAPERIIESGANFRVFANCSCVLPRAPSDVMDKLVKILNGDTTILPASKSKF